MKAVVALLDPWMEYRDLRSLDEALGYIRASSASVERRGKAARDDGRGQGTNFAPADRRPPCTHP